MRPSLLARAFLLLLVLLLASACAKPTATTSGPVKVCTKAEQQCEYADGKIGLCTSSGVSDGVQCDGGSSCLVCMSLH